MTVAGMVVALNNIEFDFGYSNPNTATSTNNDETLAGVLVVAGVAAMLASIGLFVSAHKNKKKALSISFKNELVPQLQSSMVFYKSIPSLSLKISL